MPASSAGNLPHTALRFASQRVNLQPVFPEVLLEVNQIPQNTWVFTEACQHGVYHSSEEDIEQKR